MDGGGDTMIPIGGEKEGCIVTLKIVKNNFLFTWSVQILSFIISSLLSLVFFAIRFHSNSRKTLSTCSSMIGFVGLVN